MKPYVLIVILSAMILAWCSPSVKVYSDYDQDADISKYNSYSWLTLEEIEGKGNNPLYYNELNDKRIRQAVLEQMKRRGFSFHNEKQALEIHYHIIVEDKTLLITEPLGYSYSPIFESKKMQSYPYQQGTLIIDLMDSNNKTLVWRGWATGAIEGEYAKNPGESINAAVKKIFTLFPYTR